MSKLELIKEIKDKGGKLAVDNNQENIYINVLIRDKKFKQYCGSGLQKIRWLIDCAIYKFEISSEHKVTCGPAYGLKMENGALCDLNKTIASTLPTGANVLVLLKEEYDVEMEDKMKKKNLNMNQINLVNNFYDDGNDDYRDEEERGIDGGDQQEEDYNYENDGDNNQNEEEHYLPQNDNYEYDKEEDKKDNDDHE